MAEVKKPSPRLFNGISWGVTGLIVISLLGFTFWRIFPAQASPSQNTTIPAGPGEPASLPGMTAGDTDTSAIVRAVSLDTSAEDAIRYDVVEYSVERGDTVSSIAASFGIESSSLMWANEKLMEDGPNSLSVGQVLLIPPVDGVLYKWEEGDSLETVADEFDLSGDDILLWPGNRIDLADPIIEAGDLVMLPGAKSDAIMFISPVFASGSSGTSTGRVTSCGDVGPIGGGGFWCPLPDCIFNGGNDFDSSHLGLDLFAFTGTSVFAADHGVVVWSSYGEWNGGYGSVVMIDHRNGYMTLYGHLSQVNVLLCEPVYANQLIGEVGNSGNSYGPHLHFEIRLGGGFLNPRDFLPPMSR